MKKKSRDLLKKPRKLWTQEEISLFEYVNSPEVKERLASLK